MGRKHRMNEEWTLDHVPEKYWSITYTRMATDLKKLTSSKVWTNMLKAEAGLAQMPNYYKITKQDIKDMRSQEKRLVWKIKIFEERYPEYVV